MQFFTKFNISFLHRYHAYTMTATAMAASLLVLLATSVAAADAAASTGWDSAPVPAAAAAPAPVATSFYEGLGQASATTCSCLTSRAHNLDLQGNAFVDDWLFLNHYAPRRLRAAPSPDSTLARATYRDTIFVHDGARACISFATDFFFGIYPARPGSSAGGSFAFLLGDLSFVAVVVDTSHGFRAVLDVGGQRAVAAAVLNHTATCLPPGPAFGGCGAVDEGAGFVAMARAWIEYDAPSLQLSVSISWLGLREDAVTVIRHKVRLMCHTPSYSFVGFRGQGNPDQKTGEVHQVTKWTFNSWLSPLDHPGITYSCD